jgi:homoserine dehydrogenase
VAWLQSARDHRERQTFAPRWYSHRAFRSTPILLLAQAQANPIKRGRFVARRSKQRGAVSRPGSKKVAPVSQKWKVALVGYGTVGRSVAKILCEDTDGPFALTHIFNRNIARKKTAGLPAEIRWTENIEDVLQSDANILVEVIGGLDPAGAWIDKALRCGKSVVTANKQLICQRGAELMKTARQAGRRLEFGASVAGGIPAIIGIQEGLAGDRLYRIAGILNGTCNFILTKMESTGATFGEALKEAQQLGFAEADPTADVEGYDARAKLVILTQAGLRVEVRDKQVPTRSITTIQAVDFLYARDLNCTIRQLSLAQRDTSDGLRLFAAVQPAVIPTKSLMAHVQGSQNMVLATGQYAGRMIFSGYGAGGDPTAVAVVSDLYAIARTDGAPSETLPDAPEIPDSVSGDFTLPHYLRFVVNDRPGILAEIATVLAKYSIGVDAVLQKPGFPAASLSFVMTLEACDSAVLGRALREIAKLDFHVEPPLCLPIYAD